MLKGFFCQVRRLCSVMFFLFMLVLQCYPLSLFGNRAFAGNIGKKQGLNLALGYVSLSGNAKSETGSFKVDYQFLFKKIYFECRAYYIFTDITDVKTGKTNRTNEKYYITLKSNYKKGKKSGIFTNLTWYKNRPSGINKNLSIAGGYSRILIDNDRKKSKFGLGVEGYKEEKIINFNLKSNSSIAAYFEFSYAYAFNKSNRLKFENETRINVSNTTDYRLSNNFSYSSALNEKMAIEINYIHQYKNFPVPGKKKTDTTTTINLVFRF